MLDFLPMDRLPENLAYLIYSVRQLETIFDLLLVALTYFGILMVVRRSQAAVLLRGILVLALLAIGVSAWLTLPTFTAVLRGALILGLIATPLIFQPELRRGIERLGRSLGFLQIRPTELVHSVVPVLMRVTSDLSQRRIGALIVLEGTVELGNVIATGVPLHADLSADLLETIFQDKTPLHDGAVVVREDRVVAAACVLPLSAERTSSANSRICDGSVQSGKRDGDTAGVSLNKSAHLSDLSSHLVARQMPAGAGLGTLPTLEVERLDALDLIPGKAEPGRRQFVEVTRVLRLLLGQHAPFAQQIPVPAISAPMASARLAGSDRAPKLMSETKSGMFSFSGFCAFGPITTPVPTGSSSSSGARWSWAVMIWMSSQSGSCARGTPIASTWP